MQKSSVTIKERAYKAYIRPLLEYAATVWDPYTQKAIDRIEAVQRRAARFVTNCYHQTTSANNIIQSLGWPSLKERRLQARLAALHKIQTGLIECPIIKNKLTPKTTRQRRTHGQQLSLITTRTQYRGSSFLPQTVKDWNALTLKEVEEVAADCGSASCCQ